MEVRKSKGWKLEEVREVRGGKVIEVRESDGRGCEGRYIRGI